MINPWKTKNEIAKPNLSEEDFTFKLISISLSV